jgi:hypothetical protein
MSQEMIYDAQNAPDSQTKSKELKLDPAHRDFLFFNMLMRMMNQPRANKSLVDFFFFKPLPRFYLNQNWELFAHSLIIKNEYLFDIRCGHPQN